MVQSHVMLVPAASAGLLTDLGTLLAALPEEVVPEPPLVTSLQVHLQVPATSALPMPVDLHELANLLTDPGRSRPVVYPATSAEFQVLLQALWARLRPEWRRTLRCLPAFEPGRLDDERATWFVLTPAALASNWIGFPRVRPGSTELSLRPASRLLLGEVEAYQAEFLMHLSSLPAAPQDLDMVISAAQSLDAIRADTADSIERIQIVRLVGQLAPSPTEATLLKSLLIQHAATGLDSPRAALALSNLDLAPYTEGAARLAEAIATWATGALQRPIDDDLVRQLITHAARRRGAPWWIEAIRDGVERVLQARNPEAIGAAWRWWVADPALFEAMDTWLPVSLELEATFAQSCPASLPLRLAESIAAWADSRGWAMLHARVLAAALPAREVIVRQCRLAGGPGAGLQVLAQFPAEVVLAFAIEQPEPTLFPLVGELLMRRPDLLNGLDPGSSPWRQVWHSALRLGLPPWAGVADSAPVLGALVEEFLNGADVPVDLLTRLAVLPQGQLLDCPRRVACWARLPEPTRSRFLESTAVAWLDLFASAVVYETPEEPLCSAVVAAAARWDQERVPIERILAFLELFPDTSEHRFTGWLQVSLPVHRLAPATARRLRHTVCERRWYRAKDTIRALRTSGREDLDEALPAWWERVWPGHLTSERQLNLCCICAWQDEEYRTALRKQLRAPRIRLWSNLDVLPGCDRTEVHMGQLKEADVIVLLISPDFFNSDECEWLLQLVQERRGAEETLVIPVLVRAVAWMPNWIDVLASLPDNRLPVAEWLDDDAAWSSIARGILRASDGRERGIAPPGTAW